VTRRQKPISATAPREAWENANLASEPLIFHIPHASIAIPPEARQGLAVTDAELAIELLHMTDRYTEEIFERAVRQGDAVVEFPVSRLVVDPERFVDDDKEAMAARGMGVVCLRRHDGSPLRADLTQKAALVRDYYEPHHRLLDECVSQHLRTYGRAIIIDCHSFPSIRLPYELVQDQQRPEICIGADPVHTPEWLSAALVSALGRQGYSVSVDILTTIERLAELRQKNILTEEEFAAKKSEPLSRL
jgi:N-formylglutamate deformylase